MSFGGFAEPCETPSSEPMPSFSMSLAFEHFERDAVVRVGDLLRLRGDVGRDCRCSAAGCRARARSARRSAIAVAWSSARCMRGRRRRAGERDRLELRRLDFSFGLNVAV